MLHNLNDSCKEAKEKQIIINSQVNEIFSKTNITQIYINKSKSPIELKIYVYKSQNFILSNFSFTIGNSIKVKSKIIKKEKAKLKYSDSISSGNSAIYVINDPSDKNRIIINIGNIPPNEEVTFESEYIQFIESYNLYEFELFRYLPIFIIGDSIHQFMNLEGKI